MNLLITGAWQSAGDYIPQIEKMGNKVFFMQQEKDELPCDEKIIEGVICNGLFLYHDIKTFEKLKYIQLTSAGFDRVPMEYINKKEITVRNAHGVYSIPMAEYALCGVLSLYKNMKSFGNNQDFKLWEKDRNLCELFGKKVCVVGCGNVGNECAKRFNAFGCDVFGIDLYPHEDDNYEEILPVSNLPDVLSKSDVVVLTLPLTEETKGLFGNSMLQKFKTGSVMVNIARGPIVDEKALCCALKENIGGAVLDVFSEEPLSKDSPLWEMENVIITPHNSFIGENNFKRLDDVIINNLKGQAI